MDEKIEFLKHEDSVVLFTVEEFIATLSADMKIFVDNMNHLKRLPVSFPEWYEIFGYWLEVGTSMETMYHGKRSK